jgi:anthranilate synthase component 1
VISLSEARDLSKRYQVIPIVDSVFSGTETPLSIFEKLAALEPGSFPLESAEQGVWSRYSFVGVSNLGFLASASDSGLTWTGEAVDTPQSIAEIDLASISGFEALEQLQKSLRAAPVENLPPLVSGMVGLMGWDTIHQIESLAKPKLKEVYTPDLAMAVIRDMVIVDHLDSSLKLVSNIYLNHALDFEVQYQQALERIVLMKEGLLRASDAFLAEVDLEAEPEYLRRTSDSQFMKIVERAKEHVVIGDVFQVVVSQRFDIPTKSSALDVYRMLRAINPSPYMYLLNFFDDNGQFAVVGSSPEALVRVKSDKAVLHPIAGSRPRGATAEADSALASELSADEKEKAEHLMLVDLARNDLLKVCEPATVAVTEFMTIERYSHIMHLVSTVEGTLKEGTSAVDVVKATFPAGTLSGAPKPRALEIIEDLEPVNRGLFGGVVGYFDFAGNADLAIAIRTAVIRDGSAHIQAGAGIVLDSLPETENQETITKASAPLRAVQAANSMVRFRL